MTLGARWHLVFLRPSVVVEVETFRVAPVYSLRVGHWTSHLCPSFLLTFYSKREVSDVLFMFLRITSLITTITTFFFYKTNIYNWLICLICSLSTHRTKLQFVLTDKILLEVMSIWLLFILMIKLSLLVSVCRSPTKVVKRKLKST